MSDRIQGRYIDVFQRNIYPAEIEISDGIIAAVRQIDSAPDQFIMPGFIDAHIHIESSMLVPSEFGKIALRHGTVATVSDPHEIANVNGIAGVVYMIENAALSPLKFHFGAPSCVPATAFETAGARLDAPEVAALLERPDIFYLAEMMNFPGVLHNDREVLAKIAAAQQAGKPVDGHAPGLRGSDAASYAHAGMTTDHECTSIDEALDKLNAGMQILIREGSAAKNFEALIPLIKTRPGKIMFCSDDKHPDELLKGHINLLAARAVSMGYDLFDVLHAACVLPVTHYGLPVGLLRKGDPADFIIIRDTQNFHVTATFINGKQVAEKNAPPPVNAGVPLINNFAAAPRQPEDFLFSVPLPDGPQSVKVIDALDGQLLTGQHIAELQVKDGAIHADPNKDILKIGVVNRYCPHGDIQMAFVRNFGLKKGAIASTVAHDSHNIVFVGVSDHDICGAVNALIHAQGGISAFSDNGLHLLPLPVAGLMSNQNAEDTAQAYQGLDREAKKLGSQLTAPFMTLSFMALPVIPRLKLTDQGLFDVHTFTFTSKLA